MDNRNEIQTIIQLRNDSSANWSTEAGKKTPLVPGEIAVEITDSGKAKLKIGTKDGDTFDSAQYFGGDVAKVFQSDVLALNNEEDDIDVIATLVNGVELNEGDCAIIKRYIAEEGGAISYTSYVYDNGVWSAMDGNYSADNVIFKSDLVLAGDYTQVGNLTKDKKEAKTIKTAGNSVSQVFQQIFTKRLDPAITSTPGANVKLLNNGSYTNDNIVLEVGSTFTPSWSASLSAGAYTYGPATGITATSWEITDTNGNSATSATGSFDQITITDNTSYTITAKATHGAGTAANDNLGTATDVKIAAGTKEDTTGTVSGYRGWFYGYKNGSTKIDVNALDSAKIRALTKSNGSIPGELSTSQMQQMFFAIPAGKKSNVIVENKTNGAPQDVYGPFTVYVKGANDYMTPSEVENGGKAYDVWYVNNAAPDSGANTYTIKLS